MGKSHSKPHNSSHLAAIAAQKVVEERIKRVNEERDRIREEYERQLNDIAANDWMMNLAASCIVYYEKTGSKQKTEQFAQRLADKLQEIRDTGQSMKSVLSDLERMTGIELEVER